MAEPGDPTAPDQGTRPDDAQTAAPTEGTATTCAVCGKERPAGFSCSCDGAGPIVPEGWDPELTRGSGPRLPLIGRPGGQAG